MPNGRLQNPLEAKGPLSFVRATIAEVSINTLAEVQVQLPVDISLGAGILVRTVDFEMIGSEPDPPAADDTAQSRGKAVWSTRNDQTSLPRLNTPGVFAIMERLTVIGSAPADAGLGIGIDVHGAHWGYGGFGVLLATKTISLYVQGSNESAGNQLTVRSMIGFHLVEITDRDILAAISTISDVT